MTFIAAPYERSRSVTMPFKELVAELGAAFLCAKLTIEKEPRPDHVDYIVNWLEALKGNKKFIFSASTRAQDAVDYLCKA
jgi:antirestriction protein ArdC